MIEATEISTLAVGENSPPVAACKYRAFLSYSHRDSAAAKRLHARLEAFRIDKDLVGRATETGPIPKQLRPIFRDRHDFAAGGELGPQTIAALDESGALILLASPNAAASAPVDAELRLFRERHPDRPLIPLILDGSPNATKDGDPARECFPPALRELDGVLAADLRETGDGLALALAKIVARLLGLPPDEVFRRARREQRRRARIRHAIMGALAVLALAATGSALYAWHELKTNQAFLDATLKTASGIVDTAVQQAEKYNVPRAATLTLLAQAEVLFDDMAKYGRETPELRYRKAWMLIQFARNYAIVGDTEKEKARALAAQQLLASLAKDKPDDIAFQWDLSVADDEVGNVLIEQGKLTEALQSYRDGLAVNLMLLDHLTENDEKKIGLFREISISYNRIGNILLAQGNPPEALKSYRGSLAIMLPLARGAPQNADWQHDLSTFYDGIGDALEAQGNLPEALASYRSGLAIRESLAKTDPLDALWQRDLSVSYFEVAGALVEQGDLTEALQSYRDGVVIIDRLAKTDPQNAIWERDLSSFYQKIGGVLAAEDHLLEALQSYRAGMAITDRLARIDPQNTELQRDLSLADDGAGNVLAAQGHLAEALQSYHDSLAIRDRLAKTDPNNAGWQRDLSISEEEVGDILFASGDLVGALRSYRDDLAIRDRLANSDASNAVWQRDLSVTANKVGDVLVAQGHVPEALQSYRDSLAIRDRLAKADPSNTDWQRDLAISYATIGNVLIAQGNLPEAIASYRDGLPIRDRIAKSDPGNANWQRALAVTLGNLAWAFVLDRKPQEALDAVIEALKHDPSQLFLQGNKADALLLLGRFEEAKAIYLAIKDKPRNGKTFADVIREDFSEMRKFGIDTPDMKRIEAILQP